MRRPASETVELDGSRKYARRASIPVRLLRNRVCLVALIGLTALVLMALFADFIVPKDPTRQALIHRLEAPSSEYLLGTDGLGRDTLSRLIAGSRVTLSAATMTMVIAISLGVPFGLLAGYLEGWVDTLLGRIADAWLSLPGLILALAIVGVLGPGITNAMMALGVAFAPRYFRVARSAALAVKNELYVEAARSVGCPTARIVGRHILPNASGPLVVQSTFGIGHAVTAEASLSFLGLGALPPAASWGTMLRDAFATIYTAAFPIYPPSIMIILTILIFFIIGDTLRDVLAGRDTKTGG